MAAIFFFVGAAIGATLLMIDAAIWGFFVAPLALVPFLIAYLEMNRRGKILDTEIQTAPFMPASTAANYVYIGEVSPSDPYLSLMSKDAVLVVSDPSDQDLLEVDTARRLGMTIVTVSDRGGFPTVHRDNSFFSKIYGLDVFVGPATRTPGSRSVTPILRGFQQMPEDEAVDLNATDPIVTLTA